MKELKRRLIERGTDSEEVIKNRLKIAKQEAAKSILRDKTPAIVCPSIIEDSSSKIESTIDEIVTNNLFKTNSALAKDSSKVKDDIINHYDSSRKLILKRLKK